MEPMVGVRYLSIYKQLALGRYSTIPNSTMEVVQCRIEGETEVNKQDVHVSACVLRRSSLMTMDL